MQDTTRDVLRDRFGRVIFCKLMVIMDKKDKQQSQRAGEGANKECKWDFRYGEQESKNPPLGRVL